MTAIRIDEEEKRQIQFGTKAVHCGRHPLALIGKKYVACADRDGKDVVIIENNDRTNFKHFTKIEVSVRSLKELATRFDSSVSIIGR